MGPVLLTAIFLVMWWVVFFAVLPWGVRGQHEDDAVVPGTDPGAPVRPMLWRKAAATTLVTGALWLGLFYTLKHPPAPLVTLFTGVDGTPRSAP